MKLTPTELEPTMRQSKRLVGLSAIALFAALVPSRLFARQLEAGTAQRPLSFGR